MKHFLYIALLCVAAVLTTGCTSQSKQAREEERLLAVRDSIARAHEPQRMQPSDATERFEYRGKKYEAVVTRRPDEALPMLKNEEGEVFVDNRITLRISREGKQLVNRTFTKSDFAPYVEAGFLKHALLEGIVFNETAPEGIRFAASVGYPQSDLYVPLRLTVSADGKLSIAKEELMEGYRDDDEEASASNE